VGVEAAAERDHAPLDLLDSVLVAGDASQPSTGVGEPGAVPTAAAIANAVYAASGARLRLGTAHAGARSKGDGRLAGNGYGLGQ